MPERDKSTDEFYLDELVRGRAKLEAMTPADVCIRAFKTPVVVECATKRLLLLPTGKALATIASVFVQLLRAPISDFLKWVLTDVVRTHNLSVSRPTSLRELASSRKTSDRRDDDPSTGVHDRIESSPVTHQTPPNTKNSNQSISMADAVAAVSRLSGDLDYLDGIESYRLFEAWQVAEILSVSTRHVHRLKSNGELPFVPVGAREVRFKLEDVLAYIDRQRSCS